MTLSRFSGSSVGFFILDVGKRENSIVDVFGFRRRFVPIIARSMVSGPVEAVRGCPYSIRLHDAPHTKSAPYLSASSREGSSPERTMGARTTFPR